MDPQVQAAHQQLVVLGLELLAVLALATVAEQGGWGGPAVLLLVLLWALFLMKHADALRAAFPTGGTG